MLYLRTGCRKYLPCVGVPATIPTFQPATLKIIEYAGTLQDTQVTTAKHAFHVQRIAPCTFVCENGENVRKAFGSGPEQVTNAPEILEGMLIKFAERFFFSLSPPAIQSVEYNV